MQVAKMAHVGEIWHLDGSKMDPAMRLGALDCFAPVCLSVGPRCWTR